MPVVQTANDLCRHLEEHLGHMVRSAAAYDAGETSEAKRLAVSLRVLFHQTANSHALFTQLGVRSGPFMCSPRRRNAPGNLLATGNLLSGSDLTYIVPGGSGLALRPYLNNFSRGAWERVPFEEWWEGTHVLSTQAATFTRRELVHVTANLDGGAHVDGGNVAARFADLLRVRGNDWYTVDAAGGTAPALGIELACIRQIAHEALMTIQMEFRFIEAGTTTLFVRRPGRHAPCPCGSGRQFQRCHGRA